MTNLKLTALAAFIALAPTAALASHIVPQTFASSPGPSLNDTAAKAHVQKATVVDSGNVTPRPKK
jgi:hypothetical protein